MAPGSALLVHKQWADLILDGTKVWELRNRPTTKRCVIGLAITGTSCLYGECTITGCAHVAQRNQNGVLIPVYGNEHLFVELEENVQKHRVCPSSITYNQVFAWTISEPKRYERPVPFKFPSGAVTWIDLRKVGEDPAKPKAKLKVKKHK